MKAMCVNGTPVEDYRERYGLYVKREDTCCPNGPHFSKTRGVFAHVKSRPEPLIGVLDTAHSQGGWAVAHACALLGKKCRLFYPVRKAERDQDIKDQQRAALQLGAELVPLQAGRSAVLYHTAKKALGPGGYMMPNALKLPEMITETVAEVERTNLPPVGVVLVSASSGTIAAGVIKGLYLKGWEGRVIVHQGYDRSEEAVRRYMSKMIGMVQGDHPISQGIETTLVNEGYAYADEAKPGEACPFPSNRYYDLKCFRWWVREGRAKYGEAVLWNIG